MALYIVEVPDTLEQSEGLAPGSVPRLLATFVNGLDSTEGGDKPADQLVRVFQPSYKLREVLQTKISDGAAALLPDLSEDEFDQVMSAEITTAK